MWQANSSFNFKARSGRNCELKISHSSKSDEVTDDSTNLICLFVFLPISAGLLQGNNIFAISFPFMEFVENISHIVSF